MAVFRVERNTGYTVMSNHHLRNKELSLFRVGTSCIFCSMNARSSSVTLNLICTVRFLPFIGSHSFPFRGFGTLPNKQFSTDAPQRRRAKIRKGYPFPMLAMKVFSYSLLQQKAPFCQTYAKEKRCNLKKRLQRFLNPVQFCRTHLICPLFRL